MIKSVYENQDEILNAILELHCPEGFHCDVTYGNGSFYKNIQQPEHCFDIQPLHDCVKKASSTWLPLASNSLRNIVFDPPFLTYIKQGREHNSIMGKRFSGYWAYSELETHYIGTIKEASRTLIKKGVLVFKCQDLVHNHKLHSTHINVVKWAETYGFRLKDNFLLIARNRIPTRAAEHGVQTQKHARIFHSYFLILEKL